MIPPAKTTKANKESISLKASIQHSYKAPKFLYFTSLKIPVHMRYGQEKVYLVIANVASDSLSLSVCNETKHQVIKACMK